MNLALLLEEHTKLNVELEYTKNRLIFYSKRILEIEQAKKEYNIVLEKIGEILNTLEYLVFYQRFILNKKIKEIAEKYEYSETHIKRIIKNIKKKLNDTEMEL